MFNERKTKEAICYLLGNLGGRTEYLKLTKLLYFADRTSIERRGRTITGDEMYALPKGPILSAVLNELNGSHSDFADIVISDGRYQVKLIHEEPPSALSFADLKVLSDTIKQYGHLTWQELIEESHKLPEWKKYDRGEDTWSRISLEDVAEALGLSEEQVRAVIEYSAEMVANMTPIPSRGPAVPE